MTVVQLSVTYLMSGRNHRRHFQITFTWVTSPVSNSFATQRIMQKMIRHLISGHFLKRWLVTASVAAAIAALLVVTLLFPPGAMDYIPMTERIALEVARNHIKLKSLDVETGSMDGIRRYFTDLEFVPVESSMLAGADLELVGGRYCSLQSVPAAQLRIVVPYGNRQQTLYQAKYHKDVFGPLPVLENGNAPVTVNVKGIMVRIWVEKGLLFALTDEVSLEPIIPPE